MMRFSRFYLLVVSVIVKQETQASCNERICLRWTLVEERLELTCYIRNPYNMVHIIDHEGRPAGDCIPVINTACNIYYSSAKLFYDISSKNFTFTLRILSDTHITGVWKCKHGQHGDTAEVYIYTKSNHTDTQTKEYKLTTEEHDLDKNDQPHSNKTEDFEKVVRRYAIPMGIVFSFVIILTIGVKIVMGKTCSTQTIRQNDVIVHPNPSHIPSSVDLDDQVDENEHDYVSVNEDEMIPDDGTPEIQINEHDNYSDKTSTHYSKDSNNPYLDVVHDLPVPNEYEKADNPEQEISHDYTTTVNRPQQNTIYINELI